ncbi:transcriptional adapter 2-alpha-like [Anneissia japonica]|uniref:transcriptional adapter 2-alpha-like n=1 Tax=Anneissia japonica TaxID=1529436 RepID=UPI0014259757|nr:transcriptional adapter 2-alpha-like [Anneissia japonica]
MALQDRDKKPCPGCSSCLIEPYIRCIVCGPPKVCICLQCFSHAWEDGKHQSDHDYEIIANQFSVLDSSWTAKEELKFLDAIGDCGLGNWQDVAVQVQTKTKLECERHYNRVFINNSRGLFPSLPQLTLVRRDPIICRMSEDPPRPSKETQRADMAGYTPARGDFNAEFDNYAEHDVLDIYFQGEEEPLLEQLKVAAVDIYSERLQERQRRKRMVRNYGLINIAKIQMTELGYDKVTKELNKSLNPFMKLQTPLAHDKLLEGLIYENDLKKEVKRLQEFRRNGIKSFKGARLFDQLKRRRERSNQQRTNHLSHVLNSTEDPGACCQLLQRFALLEAGHTELPPIIPSMRRAAPPLNLLDFPGYERLNEKEREMCASVRIIPEAYFEYKRIFQAEYQKLGYLKLKHARNLIRIDVNKIRKLFDFLIKECVISNGNETEEVDRFEPVNRFEPVS